MKNVFSFLTILSLFVISCGNPGANTATGEMQTVENRDADGNLTETGQTVGGQKNGTWTTYDVEKGLPSSIKNYNNGALDGVSIEFNNRGQIEKLTHYKNNQMHGQYGTYKFGRPVETATYSNGKMHGTYRAYFNNSDKLQKEAEYKDGVQHGSFKQFNEEGQLVLEYTYDNGEVVSGGMVQQ